MGPRRLEEFAQVIQSRIGKQVSPQFLSNVINGHRSPSGPILDYLGLERVVVYKERR